MKIKVGCCGYAEAHQKYYAEFEVVEIQRTFYQLPKPQTARKWREEAPSDFEFTMKAWQLITHEPSSPTYRRLKERIPAKKMNNLGSFKSTAEVLKAWERTAEIAQILKAKIIVFQCPPSFKPSEENKENLRDFFRTINKGDYIFAWEPRGKWSPEEIRKLCQELNLLHCVDPFKNEATYGQIGYYRLHGIGAYSYRYTDQDLEKLKVLGASRMETYFMFNNVSMLNDARRFMNIIKI